MAAVLGDSKGTGIETARKMAKFENYNEETGKAFEEEHSIKEFGK